MWSGEVSREGSYVVLGRFFSSASSRCGKATAINQNKGTKILRLWGTCVLEGKLGAPLKAVLPCNGCLEYRCKRDRPIYINNSDLQVCAAFKHCKLICTPGSSWTWSDRPQAPVEQHTSSPSRAVTHQAADKGLKS